MHTPPLREINHRMSFLLFFHTDTHTSDKTMKDEFESKPEAGRLIGKLVQPSRGIWRAHAE